jgi:hypothetical protein
MGMGLYIARVYKNLASGRRLAYHVLRRNEWDYASKRQVTRYVCYLGKRPVLPLSKALKLARRLRLTLDDLRRVRGLTIVSDGNGA